MADHAKLSPSSAHRWLRCTAAPGREAGLRDETSEAAERGTLYHEVAERMLNGEEFAVAFDSVTILKNAHLMDRDDCQSHVIPYVAWAEARSFGEYMGVEDRVELLDDLWGTVDLWGYENGSLTVADFKTGRHPVSPVKNPQGIIYALGVLMKLPSEILKEVKDVWIVIFQGGEAKEWGITPSELQAWSDFIDVKADEAASGGVGWAGEWCRWCKAKVTCPDYTGNASTLVSSINDVASTETSLANMDPQLLSDLLTKGSQIEAFMETARAVAAERAFAGVTIPGYKVIRGTKHKAWIDKEKARKKLGDLSTAKDMTPAQALKVYGEKNCDGLWEVPEGPLKIVEEGAKGKAVSKGD